MVPLVPATPATPATPPVQSGRPVEAVQPAQDPAGEARPRRFPALRHLGPNWYACVMGTAIIASAGTELPVGLPGLPAARTAAWALSAVLLAALLTARAGHWTHHRDQARAHLRDPAVAPFYGCLAMALLAVGGATLSAGQGVIGERAAVAVDAVLFTVGTLTALVVAVTIPYLMIVRHRVRAADTSPVWLLPVVAPMVSAALGPLLVPYLPEGPGRAALLLACCAMFVLSMLATLTMLPLIFRRLLRQGPPPLAMTPALFLVLGPLGQSTTAVSHFAEVAPSAVGAPYASALGWFAVAYGAPVLSFALLWLALAATLVVRAVRRGMPFSMTWWAFTFPVGTCVTGAAGLARHTGLVALEWTAVGLFVLLAAAWAVAWTRTAGGVLNGALPAAPPPPSAPPEPRP